MNSRIRELRRRANMTQDDLAAATGLSQAVISRYELRENDPSGESLKALALALACSSDYLLGLTDDPRPYRDLEELAEKERALLKAFRAGDKLTAISLVMNDDMA